MATLDPNIIKDTKTLISLYQRNLSFRTAFDRIVKRNINATYQGRPIKLYVEVLSSISTRYRLDYKQVRKIVLHDKEGKVGELFKKVRPYDFYLLDSATRAAQQGLNNTSYSAQDIEQINNIEKNTKDRKQKGVAYTKRIDEITKVEKQAEEQPIPGSSPEHKKSYQPASPEEKARLDAAVNKPLPQVSKDTLVGVNGKPLIKQTTPEHPTSAPITSQQPPRQFPSTPGKTSSPSRLTPNLSGNRSWAARVRGFFRRGVNSTTEKVGVTTVTEGVVTRFGTRFAAGRAAAAGAGKLVARFGVGTAVKAGVGILAKLGVSLVTGIATAGVGLVVGVAVIIITTFPGLVKKLFKTIFWIVVGTIAFMIFMMISQRGIKMNSLLPPYSVGFAEPLPSSSPSPTPSGSPTPSITPPGGAVALCPIPGGIIACGPSKPVFTTYSNCNKGHCAGDYGYPSWCRDYPGTSYAIDIPGAIGQNVLIPSITDPGTKQAHPLDCLYVGQVSGDYVVGQIITQFSCTDTVTSARVWVQFHHLQNNYNVAIGTRKVSGDSGGNIARDPDGFNHVHVQIGINGGCGADSSGCVAADQYLQCGR